MADSTNTEAEKQTRNRRTMEDFVKTIAAPITATYTKHDKLADLYDIRKIIKDGSVRAEQAVETYKKTLADLDKAAEEAMSSK